MVIGFRCLAVCLVMAFASCGPKESEVTRSIRTSKSINLDATHFYVSTHPDDWQLFMGEYAFDTIHNESTKTVIIVMDAGDWGRQDGYWQARELGSIASVRSVLEYPLFDGDASETETTLTVGDAKILKRTLRNVSMYFFRLPDGLQDGSGSGRRNNESIYKLYKGQIDSVTSVDGANTYTRDELKAALHEIFVSEHADASQPVAFYIQDSGPERKFAHSDHYTSQALARSAISQRTYSDCKVKAFEDYRISRKRDNLGTGDSNKKLRLVEAYDVIVLTREDDCTICFADHFKWIKRSFHREHEC